MPIPSKKPTTAPKTARERIYTELKNWIIDGTLKPDEKIFDQEIAQYFSVSRTPVREAFQLLADQKLIIISPGKESRVAPIDFEKARQTYMILAELETLALEFAFPNITEKEIKNLTKLNEQFAKALQENDIVAAKQFDQEFHNIFIRLANNDFLSNFCSTLNIHVARVDNIYFPEQIQSPDNLLNSVKEHADIINALQNQDLKAAQEAMHQNWINTNQVLA